MPRLCRRAAGRDAVRTIYSTNITPDAETGIGRWSEIANAIANVTGKRLRDLPLTREKIKDAIDA